VARCPHLYDIESIVKIVPVTVCLFAGVLLVACAEEAPPTSVGEFMENPRLLEATMVRCSQNRSTMKYETECVNARDAINRLERDEERERRAALEAQSERKRQQLRATQEAAAAARRRAEEDQRRREEEEYLGIFEAEPSGQTSTAPDPGYGVAPGNTSAEPIQQPAPQPVQSQPVQIESEPQPAPQAPAPPPSSDSTTDLDAIREELRRRQQTPE
jgi:hypothetical protein